MLAILFLLWVFRELSDGCPGLNALSESTMTPSNHNGERIMEICHTSSPEGVTATAGLEGASSFQPPRTTEGFLWDPAYKVWICAW